MEAVAPATAAAIVAAQSKVAAEIEKIVEDTKGEVRQAAATARHELASREARRRHLLTLVSLAMIAIFALDLGYGIGRSVCQRLFWQPLSRE